MAWEWVPFWGLFLTSTGFSGLVQTLWMSEITPSKITVLKPFVLQIFWCKFGEWFRSFLKKPDLYPAYINAHNYLLLLPLDICMYAGLNHKNTKACEQIVVTGDFFWERSKNYRSGFLKKDRNHSLNSHQKIWRTNCLRTIVNKCLVWSHFWHPQTFH